MASVLKKVVIAVAACFGIGVLSFAALIAYAVVADQNAMERATALCGSAAVGSPAAAALERAKKAESGTHEPQWHTMGDGDEQLYVVFPAGLPLSGYVCTIYAKDGVVTAAKVHGVD